MSTYRIGPARVLVAPTLDTPVSGWTDFGLTRGNTVVELSARDLALLKVDQFRTPLADNLYITPSANSVRFLLTDYQLTNLLNSFPGSAQLTEGAKEALTFGGNASITPVSFAIIPEREYSDDLFFLDSPSVVWFKYAFARVDAVTVSNPVEDTDDALSSTAYEVTLTRVLPNQSGIGNPLLSGLNVQGVLFAWEPSIDYTTPLIGGAGTFTRATTATYIDDDGVIQTASSGEPRYQNGGLLMEPQRTNLNSDSIDFSGYSGTGTLVRTTGQSSPDGGVGATLLEDDDPGGSAESIYKSVTLAIGSCANSYFVKKGSSDYFTIGLYGDGTWQHLVTVEWISGIPVGTSVEYEAFTDGWYRVWVSDTVPTATSYSQYFYPASSTASRTGSTYLWGLQVEQASYPTSYIPTSGSTATRNADSLTFPFTTGLPTEGMTVYQKGVFKATPGTAQLGLRLGAPSATTEAGEFKHFIYSSGLAYYYAPSGASGITFSGGPTFVLDAEDDVIVQIDVANDTARTFNASDVAQATSAITATIGDVLADGVIARSANDIPFEQTALVITKGLLTPELVRRILRTT